MLIQVAGQDDSPMSSENDIKTGIEDVVLRQFVCRDDEDTTESSVEFDLYEYTRWQDYPMMTNRGLHRDSSHPVRSTSSI